MTINFNINLPKKREVIIVRTGCKSSELLDSIRKIFDGKIKDYDCVVIYDDKFSEEPTFEILK